MQIPDIAHLNHIRKELWTGKLHGRAAVMVGSGFSLNATKRSPSVSTLPTWNQLAEVLVQELYPAPSFDSQSRDSALRRGPMRLGQEFEAAFGREALDRFLLSQIPDDQHLPGELHTQLISLPWADVLTTNYDTQLERAASRLVERRYEIVTTAADLTRARKPRIVKLHGSFPSITPFVFTEEDFRRYPRDRAPFVNLVQQVMMENTFFLIGFSGDDPNFLAWTGWVRDNLGASAPQLYHCTMSSLSAAQRTLLLQRNVVSIDLSHLVDDGQTHEQVIGRLLTYFGNGQPSIVASWPDVVIQDAAPTESLVDETKQTQSRGFEPLVFPVDKVTEEYALHSASHWRLAREQYPGWIVAPFSSRASLWEHFLSAAVQLIRELPTLSSLTQLKVLAEICWRIEVCLVPLWDEVETAIVAVVTQNDPSHIDSPQLVSDWFALNLALLRSHREYCREREFLELLASLRTRSQSSISHELNYQECLWFLGRADHSHARTVLASWTLSGWDDPIWEMRISSIYAELGDTQKALALAKSALDRSRSMIRTDIDDYTMLSREGWAMVLVNRLASFDYDTGPRAPDFRGRWEALVPYRCNPVLEGELLELNLRGNPPEEENLRTETPSFDLGVINRKTKLGTSGYWKALRPAFQLIRLAEVVGLPLFGAYSYVNSASWESALNWVASFVPDLIAPLLVRGRDEKQSDAVLARWRLGAMNPAAIEWLLDSAIRVLRASLETIRVSSGQQLGHNFHLACSQAAWACDVASRCFVASSDTKQEQVLLDIVSLLDNEYFVNDLRISYESRKAWQRILGAITRRLKAKHCLRILGSKMTHQANGDNSILDNIAEHCSYLDIAGAGVLRGDEDDKWSLLIADLLNKLSSSNAQLRWRSTARLSRLLEAHLLTDGERQTFGTLLWGLRNAAGIPDVRNFRCFAYLSLPAPSDVEPVKVVRNLLVATPIPRIRSFPNGPNGTPVYSMFVDTARVLHDVVAASARIDADEGTSGIKWNSEEAATIWSHIHDWWFEEGVELAGMAKPTTMMFDDLQQVEERCEAAFRVLYKVVLPHTSADSTQARQICEFVDSVDRAEIPVEQILPGLLRLRPIEYDTTVQRLRRGLTSRKGAQVESSLTGVYRWYTEFECLGLKAPPRDVAHEVTRFIANRTQPGLENAIDVATGLLRNGRVEKEGVSALFLGLSYLFEELSYNIHPSPAGRPINLDQVVRLRVLCARLAVRLSDLVLEDSAGTVAKWIAAARIDPMAEVRRCVEP